MHTHAKNGVGVSVINAATNASALGVLLDNGLHLVRVPYGPLKVRITAQHDVEVELHFEDQLRLTKRLAAGTHTLERGDDGMPIMFAAPESSFVCVPTDDDDAGNADPRESVRMPNYIEQALKTIRGESPAPVAKTAPATAAADDDELSFGAVTKSASPIDDSAATLSAADSADTTGETDAPVRQHQHSGFLGVVVRYVEQAPVPGVVPPSYDEAVVTFQLNPHEKHLSAVAANFHRMVPPEPTTKKWCSCCQQ